jgi:hypothetical protein
MAKRRNPKKEKALRNLEYARKFRKRSTNRYRRRGPGGDNQNQQDENSNDDNNDNNGHSGNSGNNSNSNSR